MHQVAEPLRAAFDPAAYLPEEIGEIINHQTDLPRIAISLHARAAAFARMG
jgi:hypothetical protein